MKSTGAEYSSFPWERIAAEGGGMSRGKWFGFHEMNIANEANPRFWLWRVSCFKPLFRRTGALIKAIEGHL